MRCKLAYLYLARLMVLVSLSIILQSMIKRYLHPRVASGTAKDPSGTSRRLKASLVVMGCVRDVAHNLEATISTIKRVSRSFELVRVMVFTNDNHDNTLASLGSFESGIGVNVDVLHERDVPGKKMSELRKEGTPCGSTCVRCCCKLTMC